MVLKEINNIVGVQILGKMRIFTIADTLPREKRSCIHILLLC